MARNHNDELALAGHNQAREGHDTQQAGNTYDVKNFPRLFGELIGRRIGTIHSDSKYFGCLVKYARADEFQVEILVLRNFTDPHYDPGSRLRTTGALVLTMKYEGRIDGVDRFALKGLESRTWTVGVNNSGGVIRQSNECPNYDIGIFGISEETLRKDYGMFFRIGDARLVNTKDGLPHHEEPARSNWPTIPCKCR